MTDIETHILEIELLVKQLFSAAALKNFKGFFNGCNFNNKTNYNKFYTCNVERELH